MKAKREIPTDLAGLKPAKFNPRAISDEALAGLRASLSEFGDLSGIVYNTKLGCLVAGHQRVEALKAKHGPDLAIVAEGKDGWIVTDSGNFRVRFIDWDLTRTKAAMLVANNTAIQGEFTVDAVQLAKDIEGALGDTFGALKLDELMADLTKQIEAGVSPVNFMAADENLKTDYECPSCHFKWSGKQA